MTKLDDFKALPQNIQENFAKRFKEFLTDPAISYSSLAEELTAAGVTVDRKRMAAIMDSLGVPKRSPEMVKASKAYMGTKGKQAQPMEHEDLIKRAGTENIKEEYRLGSLTKIAKKYGVSTYVVEKALRSLAVDIRVQAVGYKEIISILEQRNIGRNEIKSLYLDGRSFTAFRDSIKELSGHEISPTATYRMLKHLGIKKSEDLIRRQQSGK